MNKSSNPAMQVLSGLAIARGYAAGPVFVLHRDGELPMPEYMVELGREGEELERLRRASMATRRDLEELIAALRERTGRGDVRIFECHQMILEDPTLTAETERRIVSGHVNAAAAVKATMQGAREQFERMRDPYFRERVRDLDDVERRLLKALSGIEGKQIFDLAEPSIVVADDLTPSEAVQLPREYVLGFATNGGSATSHVALLARALGLPAVAGLGDVSERVTPGMRVLLDGTHGTMTLNPDAEATVAFAAEMRREHELTLAATQDRPAGTLADGGAIRIFANVHAGVPVAGVRDYGACGVGLYRSEYLWLNRELEPTEQEQFEAYRDVARVTATLAPAAFAVIRTLDIGGDKTVRGISEREANPFLGNRSIRYLLTHREVMRTQLRAILRASVFGRLCIMHPMVSCLEEIREAAEVLSEVKRELDAEGIGYDRELLVGIMVEVPSAALIADELAREVDFFSIGTNDLVQYTLAADRGNDAVAHLYQPLHPAVLELMRRTLSAAERAGIPVSVCGESAADPVTGVLWAAMGAKMLSMSATFIPTLSAVLRHLTRRDLDDYARLVADLPTDLAPEARFAACRGFLAERVPGFAELEH